eukprot:3678016-Karenia_brevis.AAC.1
MQRVKALFEDSQNSQPKDVSTWVLGSQGWDTPAEEREKTAKEVLASAGVKFDQDCEALAAKGAKGSVVEFVLKDHVSPMKTKLVIRGLRVSFQEGRYAWMDKQKSKEELRPSRMLHRAFT